MKASELQPYKKYHAWHKRTKQDDVIYTYPHPWKQGVLKCLILLNDFSDIDDFENFEPLATREESRAAFNPVSEQTVA